MKTINSMQSNFMISKNDFRIDLLQYIADVEELVCNYKKFKSEPIGKYLDCLLYTSPSPRDGLLSRMPSSA